VFLKQGTTASEFDYPEAEVLKYLASFCFDQTGCRMIQRKMDVSTDENFVRKLVQRLLPIFIEVQYNIFGNFLCQKVIENSTPQELAAIVDLILPIALEVSFDQFGTRTVQSIVEQLHKFITENGQMKEHLVEIIKRLQTQTLALCTDVHGNHVIQTFIVKFKATESPTDDQDAPGATNLGRYTDFIHNACMQWPLEIGTHKQGCCVMQRCLEKGLKRQKLMLSRVIVEQLDGLIED
jgi:hypothetical protein